MSRFLITASTADVPFLLCSRCIRLAIEDASWHSHTLETCCKLYETQLKRPPKRMRIVAFTRLYYLCNKFQVVPDDACIYAVQNYFTDV
jgi:hypothetical protein